MKKIKEFFEWLDGDVPQLVAGGFVLSCIVVLFSIIFFLIATAPLVFVTLMFSLVAFFISYPIYLFYKENKDVSKS